MKKRKICVVITARPSYSRIKTALLAIKNHPDLELQIILSGTILMEKFGNTSITIEKDGFVVNHKIFNVMSSGNQTSMAKTTGLALIELANKFAELKPDLVITIADRFETIATSIAASYQNIPLAHIQGGEVTGNIDEKVRHANTKLADLHFVSSEDAKTRVINMGENPQTVFNTGCPSIDIARTILNNSFLDFDPIEKYGGVGKRIDYKSKYLVVLQHPVTSEFENSKNQIRNTLEAIHSLNIPTFWFWPNIDFGSDGTSKGIRVFRENHETKIHFFKSMEPIDFLKLLKNSECLIGNSSVGIRECAYLGIPVVNIGSRQDGRLRSKNVIDCDYNVSNIRDSIKHQLSNGHYESDLIYGDGNSGKKIAHIIAKSKLSFQKKINY